MPGTRPRGNGTDRGHWGSNQWDLIAAAQSGGVEDCQHAIRTLCALNWPPLYKYIRGLGFTETDAQELTQDFFRYLCDPEILSQHRVIRGKFRVFVLAYLKEFLSVRWSRVPDRRVRRAVLISSHDFAEEERLELNLAEPVMPEQMFQQRWALLLNERVVSRMREEYWQSGKGALYEALKNFYPGERNVPTYRELGLTLRMSAGAMRYAALRLRKRSAELLREEVARTVSGRSELEEELRHLAGVLGL